MKHPFAFFLTLLLTAVGLCGTANAEDQSCNLYIQFAHEGRSYYGETVALYRVAAVSEDGQYTTIEDFAPYPVDLSGEVDWKALADELGSYVREWEVAPTLTAAVDPDGYARFHGVQPGLYLVMSAREDRCPFAPLAVTLPALHSGQQVYEVITSAAYAPNLLVPRTGDTARLYWLSFWLGCSGLGLIGASHGLRKRGW